MGSNPTKISSTQMRFGISHVRLCSSSDQPLQFAWGKHPIAFLRARLHNIRVFMVTHEKIRAVFEKVERSGFHRLITEVLPTNRKSETMFDALGGLIVVSLSVGIVVLMRLLLTQ